MSLEDEVQIVYENFHTVPSEKIIEILNKIKPLFKSQLTQDYLSGKLDAITKITEENEKKKLCKALKPYFDWYLKGL